MFSYIGLVIFAHAAHARVGKENFQYLSKPNCCICLERLPIHASQDPDVPTFHAEIHILLVSAEGL